MMRRFDIRRRRRGFTLIELLIVIGLLAALAAVVLPSLIADRTEAIVGICDYNQAGAIRVLSNYHACSGGKLPNQLHSGLSANSDGAAQMGGIPPAFAGPNGTENTLTGQTLVAGGVDALNDIGIAKLAYGSGNVTATTKDLRLGLETPVAVMALDSAWRDDGGEVWSFDGTSVENLLNSYDQIIATWVAPTTDWETPANEWTAGVEFGMELEGSCPIPGTDFAYYVCYIGINAGGHYDYALSGADPPTLQWDGGSAPPFFGLTAGENASAVAADVLDALDDSTVTWAVTVGSATDPVGDLPNDSTFTLTVEDQTNSKTGTLTMTVDQDAAADFLGTSCPECGITNP